MAEDITRVIEVDASASVQTVRELQNEVAALNKELQGLKEGTTEYAAAQQQAAQKQQQLSAAFEISRGAAEDMAVSAERLAEIAAEDQKAISGVVEAMRAMGDAGTGANGVLQNSADTLGAVTESTRQQTAAVSELEQQQNALIQQAVQEAGILSEVSNQRKALNKAISDGTISEEGAVRMKEQLLKIETTYKASLSETQATLKATTKQMQAAAGSYDQMSQQLGQLRNAYRQMGKAARESTSGQQMIGQIKALDKELKALDASMGNYQRTVGGYEEALRAVLPAEASQLVTLGKMVDTSGGVVASFAKMTAAVGRMTKAALSFIATPIGATLTAIAGISAVVAKNWDSIKETFGWITPIEKAEEAMRKCDAALQDIERDATKAATAIMDQYTASLIAAGKSEKEITEATRAYNEAINSLNIDTATQKLDAYKTELAAVDAQLKPYQDGINRYTEALDQANSEERKGLNYAINSLKGESQALLEKREEIVRKIEKAESDLSKARNTSAQADANNAVKSQKAAEDAAKAANKAAEEEQKKAKAIADANREIERRIELMNAERKSEAEGGDFAVAAVEYQQELEAFNAIVTEKGITEANANAYREQLFAEHLDNIREMQKQHLEDQKKDVLKELDAEMDAMFQADKIELAETKKKHEQEVKYAKLKRDTTLNVASSTLSSLSTILGQETAAGKAAAVASATIDTYKAANSAYAALAGIPVVGPGLGAAAAAAAIVAGIANVKQILSTSTDGAGASVANSSASPATPAIVTPPAVIQEVPIVRSLTGASEEERLNQMVSDQRVYLVYSDVEQAGRQVRVQQSETSF